MSRKNPVSSAETRDTAARGARAARAADAVHVILRHVRQLVVDDVRQLLDVEAARRDSVATSAVISPCLNISSALTRAAWLLLP